MEMKRQQRIKEEEELKEYRRLRNIELGRANKQEESSDDDSSSTDNEFVKIKK